VGNNFDIALAAGAAAVALVWALAEVWRELAGRRYPPYASLQRAAGELDAGDAPRALISFRRAGRIAAHHGDLAAVAAAWHGLARAREALGDSPGAQAAEAAAADAERQLSAHPRTA
jgi:hypothetical protein